MKFINKSIILSALAGFALLPAMASANTANSSKTTNSVQQNTTLNTGKINQLAYSRCVRWHVRCYTRKYCRRHYQRTCYRCRQYRGYGRYSFRNTCSYNRMNYYRSVGYACYRTGHWYGRCNYYHKRWCRRVCVRRVYY